MWEGLWDSMLNLDPPLPHSGHMLHTILVILPTLQRHEGILSEFMYAIVRKLHMSVPLIHLNRGAVKY